MCGRVLCTLDPETLKRLVGVKRFENSDSYHQSYNHGPFRRLPVLMADGQERILRGIKWGTKQPFTGKFLINARIEDIEKKPTYRKIINTNRCVVVANGYYEWYRDSPYVMRPKGKKEGEDIFYFAGIFIKAIKKETGEEFYDVVIMTKSSIEHEIYEIHDRMPVILENEEQINIWLNNTMEIDQWRENRQGTVLDAEIDCYPVGPMVGSIRKDGEKLIWHVDKYKKHLEETGISKFFIKKGQTKPAVAGMPQGERLIEGGKGKSLDDDDESDRPRWARSLSIEDDRATAFTDQVDDMDTLFTDQVEDDEDIFDDSFPDGPSLQGAGITSSKDKSTTSPVRNAVDAMRIADEENKSALTAEALKKHEETEKSTVASSSSTLEETGKKRPIPSAKIPSKTTPAKRRKITPKRPADKSQMRMDIFCKPKPREKK